MAYSDQDNGQALSARNDRNPLRPMSASCLNSRASGNRGLKRKRGFETENYPLGKPFTILTSLPHKEQLKLVPRLLVPRSCLPLAYFDFNTNPYGSTGSRFFSASEQTLEALAASSQQAKEPTVLVAEQNDGQRLYAVESVRQGVYALCRLGDWVRLEDLGKPPTKAKKISHGDNATTAAHDSQWWRKATLDIKSSMQDTERRSGTQGIRLAMKPPPSRIQLATAKDSNAASTDISDSQAIDAEAMTVTAANVGNEPSPPSETDPVDISGMIRTQYLELLYINKASLAYFAKGPLSRARAAAQGDSSSIGLSDLVEYLRESILSVPINDKKYSESLPKLIAELPAGITSEDEDGLLADQVRKSKKRKKISKGGLSPGEEQYVIKWWLYRESVTLDAGPGDTREQRTKESLRVQRAREIQLQVILILEVMALEAAGIPPILATNPPNAGEDKAQGQSKRVKKPLNLSTLLDVLIDRLCIWHSTSQGEVRETDLVHRSQNGEKSALRAGESDCLRDFCAEVVVPFYATRLPELCLSICRKLGGPVVPSPPRPLTQKQLNAQRVSSLSGVPTERAHHSKSRKPLERVLSDNKARSRRPPATLTRSATDSALPRFKRELSEIAMASIPASRPSLQDSKRYSQREVDLTAASQAAQAKLQKKAAIEQELQGAIAAMKKPNPRMAVKELVETSEKRAAVGLKSRKSKNPVRNPFAEGVQVMATPHANRRKNLYPSLPRPPNNYLMEPGEPEMIPPSSDSRIPSSSIKPAAVPELRLPDNPAPPSANPAILHPFPALDVTPSHPPSKLGKSSLGASSSLAADPFLDEAEAEDELSQGSPALPKIPKSQLIFKRPLLPGRTPSFESPRASGSKAVHETPSRKKASPRRWAGAPGTPESRVKGTPVKGRNGLAVGGVNDAPMKASGCLGAAEGGGNGIKKYGDGKIEEAEKEASIYQTLGWDDDIDDLI